MNTSSATCRESGNQEGNRKHILILNQIISLSITLCAIAFFHYFLALVKQYVGILE